MDLCEIGLYEGYDPCEFTARFATYVRSRHDGVVRDRVDIVCGRHSLIIITVKQRQYESLGLQVPDMWIKPIEGN